MKKVYLTVFLVILAQLSFAQAQQGNWSATGILNYNTSKSDNAAGNRNKIDSRAFTVNPSIGYFVSDKLELGIVGGYNTSEYHLETGNGTDYFYTSDYEVKTRSAGVYAKTYKFILSNLAVFAQADLSYNNSSINQLMVQSSFLRYETEIKTESDYISAAIRPGISFFVSEKISLNATYGVLSYSKYNDENKKREQTFGQETSSEYTTNSSNFDLNLSGSSLGLGLSFYF